jgi:hypothetical protein
MGNAAYFRTWLRHAEGWGGLGKAMALFFWSGAGLVLVLISLGAWGWCRWRRAGRPGLWLAAAALSSIPPAGHRRGRAVLDGVPVTPAAQSAHGLRSIPRPDGR